MPLLKKIKLEDGLLALWEITETSDQLLSRCSDSGIEPDIQGIKNSRRKKEKLAVLLLLQEIGCNNISVSYNKNNQPLINHPKYKNISISHSDKLAGIVVHENADVGLDIETINRSYQKVEHKYLSLKEQELARKTENGLALFWCAKEAIYKASGISGVQFNKQILIKEVSSNKLAADFHSNETTKAFILDYFEFEDQLIVFLIDKNNQT